MMVYDKVDINHRVYKGFNIQTEEPYGLWGIKTFDNKDIPELSGKYTMVSQAVRDIDNFLEKQPKKRK